MCGWPRYFMPHIRRGGKRRRRHPRDRGRPIEVPWTDGSSSATVTARLGCLYFELEAGRRSEANLLTRDQA